MKTMNSFTASIHSAATPLGSLLSGVFMDNCGRKLTLQIASLPVIVGWTMIAFSRSHFVLLLGRLIAGISVGLTAAAGQVKSWIVESIKNSNSFPRKSFKNIQNFHINSLVVNFIKNIIFHSQKSCWTLYFPYKCSFWSETYLGNII